MRVRIVPTALGILALLVVVAAGVYVVRNWIAPTVSAAAPITDNRNYNPGNQPGNTGGYNQSVQNPAPVAVAPVNNQPAQNQAPVNRTTGNTNTGTVSAASTDTGIVVDLLDGRSEEPRTTYALPTLGFAPYKDTGVGKTVRYSLDIPDGYTAILGGVQVDNLNKGVAKAVKGPVHIDTTIVDGYYTVVPNLEALGQFCARIQEARERGWLMTNAVPLPEWGANACR